MRYGGRETSVIESRGHRSFYKQWNRAFPLHCMRNLFVKSRKFAWISIAEARTFSRFFQRALGDLHFSTLSTNNKRNQRKSWRVNFHDNHRCTSRSHNETKLKRFGITATPAIGWGQEEGVDEDKVMWKEGVHVRSFMEAQKGKKILCERFSLPFPL